MFDGDELPILVVGGGALVAEPVLQTLELALQLWRDGEIVEAGDAPLRVGVDELQRARIVNEGVLDEITRDVVLEGDQPSNRTRGFR